MGVLQNLVSGEKVLWQGAPGRGIRFQRSDTFKVPFGLFFFVFALFWEHNALQIDGRGAPDALAIVFPIFGIPFVLAGFYLVIGRFFWEAYVRQRTSYTLTNRRALIETSAFGQRLVAIKLGDLDEISLEEQSNGRGSVIFGRDIQITFGRRNTPKPVPRFEFIPDAQRVYKLIEEVRNKPQD